MAKAVGEGVGELVIVGLGVRVAVVVAVGVTVCVVVAVAVAVPLAAEVTVGVRVQLLCSADGARVWQDRASLCAHVGGE